MQGQIIFHHKMTSVKKKKFTLKKGWDGLTQFWVKYGQNAIHKFNPTAGFVNI